MHHAERARQEGLTAGLGLAEQRRSSLSALQQLRLLVNPMLAFDPS